MIVPRPLRVVLMTSHLSPLVALLLTHHQVVGVAQSLKSSSVSDTALGALCKQRGVPYFRLYNAKSELFRTWLQALWPDVSVVFSLSQILPASIYDLPMFGTLNLHPSLLPRYRGANPVFWTYFNGDKQAGVTLHFIDDGIDTGDIVAQRAFNLPRGLPYKAFMQHAMYEHGFQLIAQALTALAEGKELCRVPQPPHSPTAYAKRMGTKDLRKLIDWRTCDVAQLHHVFSAYRLPLSITVNAPWYCKGQRWHVAYATHKVSNEQTPGRIYWHVPRPYVATPNGRLYLKPEVSVKRFIKAWYEQSNCKVNPGHLFR